MVNRMPGSNIYGSTSRAAGRSKPLSSMVAGGKEAKTSDSTGSYATASTNSQGGNVSNSSRKNVRRFVGSGNLSPVGGGTENSNSSRGSGSGNTRKMKRDSFRRTRMFQKSKRNNGSNASTSDSQDSSVSPTPASSQVSIGRSANRFHSGRRAFRGNVGRAISSATVEEREDGADSPPFPQSNTANQTTNEGSSSSSSTIVHLQQQLQQDLGAGQEESQNAEEIPRGHVDAILRFYGGDNMTPASLDLYRDVLKVSPDASDREIRIAYFRRGREILGENATKSNQTYASSKEKASKLDSVTKARFQAVSMAYEILSTPSWKEMYLQQGGLFKREQSRTENKVREKAQQKSTGATRTTDGESFDVDPFSSPPSTVAAAFPKTKSSDVAILQKKESVVPSSPERSNTIHQQGRQKQLYAVPTVLRKSSFTGRGQNGNVSPRRIKPSRQRSSSSVRWKDHVEELVFSKHPNEHASDSEYDDSDSDEDDEEEVFEDRNRTSAVTNEKKPVDQVPNSPSSRSGNSRSTSDTKTNDSGGGSSRRRRKNKTRIVIDSEELELHLKQMDNEAEKHFVQDFWDNFEESMDGILSLVDSIGGGDSTKGTNYKNSSKTSSAMPFPNPSSWLSTASSANASSASKRQCSSRRNTNVADVYLQSISENGHNNEEGMKRSNSSPLQSPSPSTLDAVSPSPPPSNSNRLETPTAATVTPDEKGSTAAKTSSNPRVSSPFEMMANSWLFQVDESEVENKKPAVISPVIVSPSPKSKSTKAFVKNTGGLSPPSTDLDTNTSMSVASSILSTSQRHQFFRPISPPSEASDLITSDFSRSNQKDGPSSGSADTESDQFELGSRLSGMGSLDLAALDNPFRSEGPSSSSSAVVTNDSVLIPSNSKDSASKVQKKKNRFKKAEKEMTDHTSVCTESSNKSEQSMEDVFAGVEEDSDTLQHYDVADGDKLKVQDISIERSPSHMSDLSASVYSSKRNSNDNGEAKVSGFSASKPSTKNPAIESETATLDPTVTSASSVLSSSTKKSLVSSVAGRSQGNTTYTSYASRTWDDTNSVHSLESKAAEASGFFDYFMAYVAAVMTECATLGATAGAAEYHQDFITLFSNDASVHTPEMREQPTSIRRVPSMSTRNTSSL